MLVTRGFCRPDKLYLIAGVKLPEGLLWSAPMPCCQRIEGHRLGTERCGPRVGS